MNFRTRDERGVPPPPGSWSAPVLGRFWPRLCATARAWRLWASRGEAKAAEDCRSPRRSRDEECGGQLPSRTRAGFTLLELMVVLVLVAIMTAMILPEMKGTYEESLLRASSRKLVAACHLAYSQAISTSQPHRLRLDPKESRYVIERPARSEEGAGFVPLKNVPGGEGELDRRIAIRIQPRADEPPPNVSPAAAEPLFPAETEPRPTTAADSLTFYPDGTADPVEVHLKDRAGFQLALRINATTARVRIVELERD